MKTIDANQFNRGGAHTGPVYYGVGALPYTAAFNGRELKLSNGQNRMFKTYRAAERAVIEASQEEAEALLAAEGSGQ